MVQTSRRGVALLTRAAPLALSLASLGATVYVLIAACRHDGGFILPVDDAYIHLAVAKHLALDGVWGVTAAGFTASVSSIGWSLLLAAIFKLTAPNVAVPIVLNVAAAGATLIVADAALRRADVSTWRRTAVLQAIVFCTPLPALVVLGMEHVVQILVVLAFVLHVSRTIASSEGGAGAEATGGALALLATFIRYDAILVVCAAVVALLIARRGRAALWIAAGAVLPLAAFGVVAAAHGWPPIPTSVLIRLPLMSEPRTPLRAIVHFFGYRGLRTLLHEPALATLLIAALWTFVLRAKNRMWTWDERQWLLAMFAGTLALHLQYAATGWMFRYEAYLVTIGLVAVALAGEDIQFSSSRRVIFVAAAIALTALGGRAVHAMQQVPASSLEQFASRHQAVRFLGGSYAGAVVEIGDIGELCYATDVRLIDVNGLGSLDLVRSILSTAENSPAAEDERRVSARADLVVTNLEGVPPPGWQLAGCWVSVDDRGCRDSYYQFYARRGHDARRLASALRAFGRPDGGLALVLPMDGDRADSREEERIGGRGEADFPHALQQRAGDPGNGAGPDPVTR
jgi:hypothetical protein